MVDVSRRRGLAVALRLLAWVEWFAAIGVVAIEAGVGVSTVWWAPLLAICDGVVLAVFALRSVLHAWGQWRHLLNPRIVITVVLAAALGIASLRIAAAVALLHDGYLAVQWFSSARAGDRVLRDVSHRPARSLVLSFLALIGVGTVLLMFPAASAGKPIAWIDALFTAVSATCVTGLITVDTHTAWSPFGQGVIFALFQLGGLGIMAVSAAMTLAFGRSLGPARHGTLGDVFDEADAEELRHLLKAVVYWTFAIEAVGAAGLFVCFSGKMRPEQALASAVFHSVSAFCNAGFSLNSDNLAGYVHQPAVSLIIAALITLGGLGFGVLVAVWRRYVLRQTKRLTEHAKLVLITSAILIFVGAVFYFFFEYDRSLAALDLRDKIVAALFQSVTTRTAGFNTVSFNRLHPVTLLVMVILMFIGASPGSTGGGIKTTTFAIVLLAGRAFLREHSDVEVFGRRIPQPQVMRAMALAGGAAIAYGLGFGALLVLEPLSFRGLMFEAASALGTVGLSLGVTPLLTVGGKVVIIMLMFVGRVGPLTAVAALAARHRVRAQVTLPEGKVLVG